MPSYSELMEQIAALKNQAEEQWRKERSEVIADIKKRIADYGIAASELGFSGAKRRTRRQDAPKYRNPVTGETWSGRGRKPQWLAEALARGDSIESFAIVQPDASA